MNGNINYKEVIKGEEYNFLRENPLLGNNVCLITLGGSRAYGTNTPDSDLDLRGFAINPTKQLFGLQNDFEQYVETTTDTVIYSLNKIVKLLLSCNPNTIEILGCKPEHYLLINKYGQQILDIKQAFLSKRAIQSFGGYADQQYNRLEHGLLGNGENDDKKLDMLKQSLIHSVESFNADHTNLHEKLKISIDKVDTETLKHEYVGRKLDPSEISNEHIFIDGEFHNLPVTDFKAIISAIHSIQSTYGNINKRNTKKTDKALAKHMMHLIRLYLMGKDLNTSKSIVTYREKEHDMLMDIRNGVYMTGDGKKAKPEFYELLREIQDEYMYSVRNTVLPDEPDYDTINNTLIKIYKDILDKN